MSLQLFTLTHLRVGWQKVCDQYNTTAYVAQLGASTDWACYTNRSDAQAVGIIIETLAPAGTRDQTTWPPAGRESERRTAQAHR